MSTFESIPQEESEELTEADLRPALLESQKFITKTQAYRAMTERMNAINEELADLRAFKSKEASTQEAALNEEAREIAETFTAVQNATGETTGGRVANPFYKPEATEYSAGVEAEPVKNEETSERANEDPAERYEILKKRNAEINEALVKFEAMEKTIIGMISGSYDATLQMREDLVSKQQQRDALKSLLSDTFTESERMRAIQNTEQIVRGLIQDAGYPQMLNTIGEAMEVLGAEKRQILSELPDVIDRLNEAKPKEEEAIVIPLTRRKKKTPPAPPAEGLQEAA